MWCNQILLKMVLTPPSSPFRSGASGQVEGVNDVLQSRYRTLSTGPRVGALIVDVVGAGKAGLGAVLFDPGRLAAARGCAVAPGLRDAAALALDECRASRERLFE